ncbi:PH domain-containing protein [Enterococcus sp. AZ163]|uniref:PH domain-containing protein n=1 Tax=Enterococcus sp. AZ163 TaxID=2774638 RepID=UPI003D28F3B7
MRTAEEMYNYCKDKGYFSGSDRNFTLKLFNVIANHLGQDEDVVVCFIGVHNRKSPTKDDGFYGYALTNRRFMMGQKRLIGEDLKSISISNLQDMQLKMDSTTATLTIFTSDNPVTIMLTSHEAEDIAKTLKHYAREDTAPIEQEKPQGTLSKAEQLLKMKELLDAGILSDEEFEQVKKDILQ